MLTYEQRERIKAAYRPIMEDKEFPIYLRIHAAETIIKCLFCRSVETYIQPVTGGDEIYYAQAKGHPDSHAYTAMLLKQGHKALHIPYDVYSCLEKRYGTLDGIKSGTYFVLDKKQGRR